MKNNQKQIKLENIIITHNLPYIKKQAFSLIFEEIMI